MNAKDYVRGLAQQPEWLTAAASAAVAGWYVAGAFGKTGLVAVAVMTAAAAAALWVREQAPVGIVPPITTMPTKQVQQDMFAAVPR